MSSAFKRCVCRCLTLNLAVGVSIQGTRDGNRVGATFGNIHFLTIDGAGNLYTTDSYNDPVNTNLYYDSIRRFDRSRDYNVTTMAGKTGNAIIAYWDCDFT